MLLFLSHLSWHEDSGRNVNGREGIDGCNDLKQLVERGSSPDGMRAEHASLECTNGCNAWMKKRNVRKDGEVQSQHRTGSGWCATARHSAQQNEKIQNLRQQFKEQRHMTSHAITSHFITFLHSHSEIRPILCATLRSRSGSL